MMNKVIYIFTTLLLISCQQEPFSSSISSDQKPYKHTQFDNADDKFTFAIFSDLSGGEREGVFETAVQQLNLLRPELIVNVGDLIEGAKHDTAEWHQQWDWFDERAAKARAPIFYMGGNHDLTGQLARHVWEERNGPRYYQFRYKDVLFLILDTEDASPERMAEISRIREEGIKIYKTEGPEAFAQTAYANLPERTSGTIGTAQAAYFKNVLAQNKDVRWTFVLIHKPAWKNEKEENFGSIEAALAQRPYTVFYGHTHVYNYEERLGRDYINLATTGGQQFPEDGPSYDHLMLITIDNEGVTMANLKMDGILNKKGNIPTKNK